jgi:hypothetical protein
MEWSDYLSTAKGKSGTGTGTGKKGWSRWQASAKRAKNFKPYASKGVKKADEVKTTSSNKESEI